MMIATSEHTTQYNVLDQITRYTYWFVIAINNEMKACFLVKKMVILIFNSWFNFTTKCLLSWCRKSNDDHNSHRRLILHWGHIVSV